MAAALPSGGMPKKVISASMVACGRSSISQCPVSGRTTIVALVATSLICRPSASPFAFSPPIERTGIVSVVRENCAKSFAAFWKDSKYAHDRGALCRREVAHPQTVALKHRARKVRPPRLLWAVERKLHLRFSGVIERRDERLGGRDDARGGVGSGGGRGRRRAALSAANRRRRGDKAHEQRE